MVNVIEKTMQQNGFQIHFFLCSPVLSSSAFLSNKWGKRLSFFGCLCFVICISNIAEAQLPQDHSDRAFVEALEQQQLFDVIAWDCETKYSNTKLSEAKRSAAAAQWLRSSMLSALNASQQSQESTWAKVDQLSKQLVAETKLFPRHFLVRFQASVTGLAQARLIRLQLKSATDPELRNRGLAAVRTSILQLGLLQRELIDAAAGAVPRTVADEDIEFSRPQFQALGNDVDFQVLACLDVQSSLYPQDDQQSRIDSWRRILELTTTLQPKLPEESKLWWQTQTIALDAARQLKDWPEWKARWDTAILRYAPPEALGDVAAAQLLRDLDLKDVGQAEKNAENFIGLIQLRAPESLNGISSLTDLSSATAWPAFDIARARLFLEQTRLPAANLSVQEAESIILSFANTMADKHGRYWSAHLTTQLLAGGTANTTTGSVSLILVQERISTGQWKEVERLITQGVQAAVAQKQADQALELATLAAGVARANGPQVWMVRAIESATLPFAENNRSEGVHFFACILAKALDKTLLPDKQKIWVHHLQKWPACSNSQRIRVQLLAAGLVIEGELDAALEYLDPVNVDSQWFPDAVKLMVPTFSDRIEQLYQADPRSAANYARGWADRWEPRLRQQEDWLNRWNAAQQKLGLLWIQAELETSRPEFTKIENLLRRITDRLPELHDDTQSRWNVLKARLAFQKSPGTFSQTEVQAILQPCQVSDLAWLAKTTAREIPPPDLTRQSLSANERGKANQAAQFFLAIVSNLQRKQANSLLNTTLRMKQVSAHVQLDQFKDAKTLAVDLAKSLQKTEYSLPAQQLLGYCLAGSNDPNDAERSEQHWRKLTRQIETGSDAWFEAKYYVAEALRRKGQTKDAYKLLAYLKLTQSEGWESNRYRSSLNRLYQALAPN